MKLDNKPTQRLPYIDIAKAIALMLIVYSHTTNCYGQTYLGSFFIAAFFLLSGYTSKYKVSWKQHLIKRAQRLLIPYLLFSVVFILLCRNFTFYDLLGVVYSRYRSGLEGSSLPIMLRSLNGPLWFFTAMFFADMLFIKLAKMVDVINSSIRVHAIVVISLLSASFLLNQIPFLLPWSLDMVPFFALFMYLGQLCLRYDIFRHIRGIKAFIILLLLIVCCQINGPINLSIRIYGHSILLTFLTGILGTLLLVWIGKLLETSKIGRLLARSGKHTLTIFSLQMFILHFVNSAISFVGYDGTSVSIDILLGIAAVIVVFIVGGITSTILKRFLPSVF
ncbi:acyltransferase family protein [Alloprevotella tannerae]|uniref:acyltransferase family protein n=1 Tax=Alloprevotella tannerae TaxID=76122 RepID=UPI0028E59E2C|nr:acyltransferase family protein [Alloprevotella tannerae]